MLTFIASLFVFSIVILVHELGHFLTAKSAGIKVDEFAIGMGPLIYKKESKGTIYSIRLFPIGGFVKMEGEDEESDSEDSFGSKTVGQRFMVIAAGAVMNFVLAIVVYIIINLVYGVAGNTIGDILEESELYKAGARIGDKIVSVNNKNVYIYDDIFFEMNESKTDKIQVTIERNGETQILDVDYRHVIGIQPYGEDLETSSQIKISDKSFPAYKAGVRTGDYITSINGIAIDNYNDLRDLINESGGKEIALTVKRENEVLNFNVTPQNQADSGFVTKLEKSFITAIVSSFYKTGYYISLLFKFIGMLVTGQLGTDAVGGPVQVVSMIGETAKDGLYPLLNLTAFISVNLGFMNLLPIPALDGSRLVFLIIEKIRGKKLSPEKEGYVHFAGFILLIALMIFVTYNDIIRVFFS